MKKLVITLSIVLMSAILGACATKQTVPPPVWPQGMTVPKRVAMMPVRNKTANNDGVELLEKILPEAMNKKGYEIANLKESNSELAIAGLYSPEDVWKTHVTKLASTVKTDGILYVSVEKWQKQYELTDTNARVELQFLFYDKNGKRLWAWRQEIYKAPGTGYADSTGDVIADILLGIVGGAIAHSWTDMDNLAVQAMEKALNSGQNPLPNYR